MFFFRYILLSFLITGIILPKNIMHFAMHLSDIVEHYEEHNTSEKISFSEFFFTHISGNNKKENKEHSGLPYNHEHSNVSDIQISVFNIFYFQHLELIVPCIITENTLIYTVFKTFDILETIFQPPK